MRAMSVLRCSLLLPTAILWSCTGGIEAEIEGDKQQECTDGEDNDGDGSVDCDDTGCWGWPFCGGDDDTGDDDTADDDVSDDDTAGSEWDLCVNEFMASNSLTVADDTGEYPDWLELHNLTDSAIELDGYSVTDNLSDPDKHVLGGGLVLPAGGYLLLWADGLSGVGPDHLGFKLAAEGEEVGLYGPEGQAINTLTYDEQVTDWSAARMPDGSLTWEIDTSPTPGASNE